MDAQELLVATQEHLARAHERVQGVVLPATEDARASVELRRARIDLEHVSAYLWGARVLTDELGADASGTRWTGQRNDVELLGRQCSMVEEMSASAARHLREARQAVGESATAGFATGVDVVQHTLADVTAGVRAAARSVRDLTREQADAPADPAVRRMRAAQREHRDLSVPVIAGHRR